jgi:hypothetical protein
MKKASSGSPNTNEPTNTELRENLWEPYFKRSGYPVPPDDLTRHLGAIEQLHSIRDILVNNAVTQEQHRLSGVAMALEVWSLLAAEIGAWIIDELGKSGWPLPEPDDLAKNERAKLYGMLLAQETGRRVPLHQGAFDPVTFFLPRWQALKLMEALLALDEGEVRPLFEPADKGRHGEAKQWDDMRQRALEHIAFLVGQGFGKGKAQKRVGDQMGGVSTNTLKDWENGASIEARRQIEIAKRAGELSVLLSSDPNYAKVGSGNAMDGFEAAKLEDLTKEDLSAFGARYSEKHGHRHNPG